MDTGNASWQEYVLLLQSFWNEYQGLVIGIGGALITLLLAMAGEFVRRKKTRTLLVIMVVGFILFTLREIVGLSEKNIIGEIQDKVNQTYDIVKNIEDKPFELYSKPLVALRDDSNTGRDLRIEAMAKPAVGSWRQYVEWITENSVGKDKLACMSLIVNSTTHSYKTGLIQAAILTDGTTKDAIIDVITSGAWEGFPDDDFVRKFGLTPRTVDCVLFFDGDRGNLVGYADARSFVRELYIKRKQFGENYYRDIEKKINGTIIDPKKELKRVFSTVNTAVVKGRDVKKIVSTMIERDVTELTVVEGGNMSLVNLLQLVELAQKYR